MRQNFKISELFISPVILQDGLQPLELLLDMLHGFGNEPLNIIFQMLILSILLQPLITIKSELILFIWRFPPFIWTIVPWL
mgnify:CR=1 FL=1